MTAFDYLMRIIIVILLFLASMGIGVRTTEYRFMDECDQKGTIEIKGIQYFCYRIDTEE